MYTQRRLKRLKRVEGWKRCVEKVRGRAATSRGRWLDTSRAARLQVLLVLVSPHLRQEPPQVGNELCLHAGEQGRRRGGGERVGQFGW